MERVIDSGGDLVGVNNRNLRTFDVELDTSLRLASAVPEDILLVAESGIEDRDTIDRLRSAGFRAFLIGEHLMRAVHPGAALRELLR
jgi:indole-3-glycerol phosphate synthase